MTYLLDVWDYTYPQCKIDVLKLGIADLQKLVW